MNCARPVRPMFPWPDDFAALPILPRHLFPMNHPEDSYEVSPVAPPQPVTAPLPEITLGRPVQRDLPLAGAAAVGAALTSATLLALRTAGSGYLQTLLLHRGWMQYASLFLAWTAFAILAGRGWNAFKASRELAGAARLPRIGPDERANRAALAGIRDRWLRAPGIAGLRRARALQAYLVSGSRSAAEAAAEDDTAQAEAALDGAYAVPRVAVWAIPLFGFIGTVVGISAAVAGFSGFLQNAQEIEQIKEGIGGVTTGLAVAFDTTLLALALSVAVMLPLVLVERWERRLTLALDADTRDAVIARLPAGEGAAAGVDEAAVRRVVDAAIRAALPSPEAMVEDARRYLEAGASEVGRAAQGAARAVAEAGQAIADAQAQSRAAAERDQLALRERLERRDRDAVAALGQAVEALRAQHQAAIIQARAEAQAAATQVAQTLSAVVPALQGAGDTLARRADELAALSTHASEALALEQSIHRSVAALQQSGRLQEVLERVSASLHSLHPAVERLAQPRRIVLLEGDSGARAEAGHGEA